jgi:hypothetical protein
MVQLSVGLDAEEHLGCTQVVKGSHDISAVWYHYKQQLLELPPYSNTERDCSKCPNPDGREKLSRWIESWQAEDYCLDRYHGIGVGNKIQGGTTNVNELFCDLHDPPNFDGNGREDIVCLPGAVRISNVGLIHGTQGVLKGRAPVVVGRLCSFIPRFWTAARNWNCTTGRLSPKLLSATRQLAHLRLQHPGSRLIRWERPTTSARPFKPGSAMCHILETLSSAFDRGMRCKSNESSNYCSAKMSGKSFST